MRRFAKALLIIMLGMAPTAATAGGGGAVKAGPKGIPFSCSDARTLRVVYDGGGMKAKAKLLFDGGEAQELKAAPTPLGRRYTKDLGEGRAMVWTTNGVEAAILESSGGAEQEVTRCHRSGRDGVHAGPDEAHEGEAH